ncbi:MAG: MlaD family protein, partial [Cyclobacteriaceae bacterium]|nr:MlaD family protein [Cyclobacteriaceae bacterium]
KGAEFFNTRNKYYAKYSNVGGLTVSNSVAISGFTVGRVSDVNIAQSDSNKVIVELEIDSYIILGKNARAILDIGLLGEATITIEPGDIANPIVSGDTISTLLGSGIAETIANQLEPVAISVESAIKRINLILDKLNGSGDQINNMIDNLEQTTLTVRYMAAETRKNMSTVIEGYKGTVENLNSKIDQLAPVITKYGQLADSLKAIEVQPMIDAAEKTMNDMDMLVKKIDESEGTLNLLLEDRELHDKLLKTIEDIDKLLLHMQSRPKDFFKPLGRDNPKGPRINEK